MSNSTTSGGRIRSHYCRAPTNKQISILKQKQNPENVIQNYEKDQENEASNFSNFHHRLNKLKDSSPDTATGNPTSTTTVNNCSETVFKEKTPMCLVNELSRYNKITHQYRLTGETGPAHKKRFTVALKLGEEEYTAEGASIKKAQHTAASDAIRNTKYPHPPTKSNRISKHQKTSTHNVTPTVELNALAMKQGLQVVYKQCNDNDETIPDGDFLDKSSFKDVQISEYPKVSGSWKSENNNVLSEIKEKSYNRQKKIQLNKLKILLNVGEQVFEGIGITSQAARHNAALKALETLRADLNKKNKSVFSDDSIKLDSDIKSPVSLLYEIAVKRQTTVTFEIQSEKGPPHMKIFTTICKVGDLVTEGEGNGKKISRKRAAENMMNELKKRESEWISVSERTSTTLSHQRKKSNPNKKKNRNLIKENIDTQIEQINPVSHLLQIQQSKKEKEPVYSLVEERGAPRKREFVMQVELNGYTVTGTGPNKKAAKKVAAYNLLVTMGLLPSNKFDSDNLDAQNKTSTKGKPNKNIHCAVGPKEQLLYLSDLLNFQVQFSDFPKGNHGDYLTLITLSTNPPQLCHGSGRTPEESRCNAATKALQFLRELGLDNIDKIKE